MNESIRTKMVYYFLKRYCIFDKNDLEWVSDGQAI